MCRGVICFRFGCYQHFKRIKNLILNIALCPAGFMRGGIMAGTVQDRDVPASGFLGGAPGPSGMAPGASRWTVSGLGRGGARLSLRVSEVSSP